jgi:hypothetical protein
LYSDDVAVRSFLDIKDPDWESTQKVVPEIMVTAVDFDGDGISNDIEEGSCLDAYDADSDDDGVLDGVEDADRDGVVDVGETDPCDGDSDGDGVQDGTELGYALGDIGSDTDTSVFIPDSGYGTTTDPLDFDTDGDGFSDGREDRNFNGAVDVDAGESDPNNPVSKPRGIFKTEDILGWVFLLFDYDPIYKPESILGWVFLLFGN